MLLRLSLRRGTAMPVTVLALMPALILVLIPATGRRMAPTNGLGRFTALGHQASVMARARANTASNIGAVSRPVLVL